MGTTPLESPRAVMWFRRDLRLHDNHALFRALTSGAQVVACYIVDDRIVERPDTGASRFALLLESLDELREALRDAGSDVVVRRSDPTVEICRILSETGARTLFFNEDYEPYARERDRVVAREAQQLGVRCVACRDHLLLEPGGLLASNGKPYSVFAPFAKAANAELRSPQSLYPSSRHLAALLPREHLPAGGATPQVEALGLHDVPCVARPRGGEKRARQALGAFLDRGGALERYPIARDLPAEPGTSRISHALKLGTLSARSCLDAVRRAVQRRPEAAKAAQKWIDELLWREFFYHILWHFPHVATSAFKSQFDRVAWRDDPQDFARWQRGETGYPIVDAGMRQLRDTAWMHNRARMIVAMFLTKDLLIDWRQGERHFMRFLADGDLASNNGGWQWCAGSGADGAPYFRIFNPTTQAIRFDPAGVYVRRYLPELAKLPDAWIHEPWRAPAHVLAEAKVTLGKTYPRPIVDHASARIRALAAYGAIRKSLE